MRVKCSCLGEGPDKLHSSVTFHPLGLAGNDLDTFADLQVPTIKISRLAMFMMLEWPCFQLHMTCVCHWGLCVGGGWGGSYYIACFVSSVFNSLVCAAGALPGCVCQLALVPWVGCRHRYYCLQALVSVPLRMVLARTVLSFADTPSLRYMTNCDLCTMSPPPLANTHIWSPPPPPKLMSLAGGDTLPDEWWETIDLTQV